MFQADAYVTTEKEIIDSLFFEKLKKVLSYFSAVQKIRVLPEHQLFLSWISQFSSLSLQL